MKPYSKLIYGDKKQVPGFLWQPGRGGGLQSGPGIQRGLQKCYFIIVLSMSSEVQRTVKAHPTGHFKWMPLSVLK